MTPANSAATVTEPGLYRMIEADYHADCCPTPSLSRSVAQILLEQSPRHAWAAHPRLNPGQRPTERQERKADIGSAAHALLLGQPVEIVHIDADNYLTKAAKAQRAEAYEAGAVPLLAPDAAIVEAMVARALTSLAKCDVAAARAIDYPTGESYPMGDGTSATFFNEITAAWRDRMGGHWCRARIDRLTFEPKRITIIDYKTTEMSAAPDDVARAIFNNTYHLQDGFYRRGIRHLFPEIDRHEVELDFLFIVQEQNPPHEITVARIDAPGRLIGEKMASAALRLWDRHVTTGEWPGYPGHVVEASIPPYVETRWLAREGEGALDGLPFDPFPMFEARPYEAPKLAGPC